VEQLAFGLIVSHYPARLDIEGWQVEAFIGDRDRSHGLREGFG